MAIGVTNDKALVNFGPSTCKTLQVALSPYRLAYIYRGIPRRHHHPASPRPSSPACVTCNPVSTSPHVIPTPMSSLRLVHILIDRMPGPSNFGQQFIGLLNGATSSGVVPSLLRFVCRSRPAIWSFIHVYSRANLITSRWAFSCIQPAHWCQLYLRDRSPLPHDASHIRTTKHTSILCTARNCHRHGIPRNALFFRR